jgi:hypothetical protein
VTRRHSPKRGTRIPQALLVAALAAITAFVFCIGVVVYLFPSRQELVDCGNQEIERAEAIKRATGMYPPQTSFRCPHNRMINVFCYPSVDGQQYNIIVSGGKHSAYWDTDHRHLDVFNTEM